MSNNQTDYLYFRALLVGARSQEFKVDLHVYLTHFSIMYYYCIP